MKIRDAHFAVRPIFSFITFIYITIYQNNPHVEEIIQYLTSTHFPLLYVFLIAFLAPFVENLLPPAPGDSLLVFVGTIVGLGKADFTLILLTATIGSTLGFLVMFLLGRYFGDKIVNSNRFKFINEKNMRKPRRWFHKYGYKVIVVNRFLSGTRSVISFLAGISNMRLRYSIVLAAISSLIWNSLLIYLGMVFGDNWRFVYDKVQEYGLYIAPVAIIIIGYYVYKFFKSPESNVETE